MELYFLRHGAAVEPENWEGEDAGRPLTNAGRLQVELVGQAMAKLAPGFGAILTSPLVRAKQTAEIVARGMHAIDQLTKEPLLSPGFGSQELSEILRARGSDHPILLVGHEPDFGDAIGQLIGGARIVIKKAGLARVDLSSVQPLAGELVWLFPPDAFEPQP
jgi:phosphohistidine phosphatase